MVTDIMLSNISATWSVTNVLSRPFSIQLFITIQALTFESCKVLHTWVLIYHCFFIAVCQLSWIRATLAVSEECPLAHSLASNPLKSVRRRVETCRSPLARLLHIRKASLIFKCTLSDEADRYKAQIRQGDTCYRHSLILHQHTAMRYSLHSNREMDLINVLIYRRALVFWV